MTHKNFIQIMTKDVNVIILGKLKYVSKFDKFQYDIICLKDKIFLP